MDSSVASVSAEKVAEGRDRILAAGKPSTESSKSTVSSVPRL